MVMSLTCNLLKYYSNEPFEQFLEQLSIYMQYCTCMHFVDNMYCMNYVYKVYILHSYHICMIVLVYDTCTVCVTGV